MSVVTIKHSNAYRPSENHTGSNGMTQKLRNADNALWSVSLFTAYIVFCYLQKLQAIYSMLYKRYKTAKIKKYKHEHVLAYTFNLSSVARTNV